MATVAFSHERAITPGASGANRLDVDVSLLAGTQPDLRDLRLLDAQQREVGYLLVTPKGEPRWLAGEMLPIKRTRNTAGFEVDLGRIIDVDRVKLDAIAPPFLKRVIIEGSGDRARWTVLADATIFDLPDDKLRHTEIAFAHGPYRYLRVQWNDRDTAPVISPAITVREHDSAARPEPVRFDTNFAKRASEPGKSRYRITLPGKRLPLEAIEVEVKGGNVFRAAQVTEPQFQNGSVLPANLGRAELKRAERDHMVAAEMAIPIDAPAGRELDLEITDGSNPPLAITAIRARLKPQPWIYFESPDGTPLRARYGNASAAKPLYDLEASRPYIDARKIATAEWSGGKAILPVPSRQAGLPALHGATIDRDRFRFSRRIPDAPPGLSVLLLDAHALSYAHGDVAQMRIVDGSGRQVPYLLERRAEGPTVKMAVPPRHVEGTRSVYRLTLPYNQLRNEGLVLTTSARVFERTVTLRRASRDHRWRTGEAVRTAEWRSIDPDDAAPPLHIDLPAGAPRAMDLIIDEGDNAPLPIASAHLLLPPLALRFDHPGTPLFLLYGNNRVSEPRYDVALLAPRLLAEPARELTLPPPIGLRAADDDKEGRKFFWIGVVIAGVVLIAMLLRVLLVSPETSRAPSDTT